MVDFAYTGVPGKLKALLIKVREIGIPSKPVNTVWLKAVGFTSSSDKTLVGVLKFLRFIDSSGIPTNIWKQYRGPDHRRVLGTAVRDAYSDLFAVYDDAHLKSRSEIENILKTSSSAGQQVISATYNTFKSLVDEADFTEIEPDTNLTLHAAPLHAPAEQIAPAASNKMPGASLHIDIQIHISPDSSPEQIDQIFQSMAKHLYGSK